MKIFLIQAGRQFLRFGLIFTFVTVTQTRDVSSVGLERYLDRVEVTGSNPVHLTTYLSLARLRGLVSFRFVVLQP